MANVKGNSSENSEQNEENCENISSTVRKIIETISPDEGFYILDVQDVLVKFNNWRKKLPNVVPYYAVKCNSDPSFLNILFTLGVCFECASKQEIETILSLGVHPSRIIFANPAKLPSHLKYAANHNVNLLTADSEDELHKIKKLHPNAEILLRVRSDASHCVINLGMKFGCHSKYEAPDLLRLAHKLQLNVIGICFHVGSGCQEPASYRRGIATAHTLFKLSQSIGFQMRILDIGGGFPGNKNSSIDSIAKVINNAIDDYFPEGSGVDVMAEPGRYFAASAFTIATYIHGKRLIQDVTTGEKINVFFIPDGIFGSFNALFYDPTTFHPIPLSQCLETHKIIPCFFCGPTSHPLDVITEKIKFPDLKEGDWILFENMGAYRSSTARYFSGFTLPKVYTLFNGTIIPSTSDFQLNTDEYDFNVENYHR